MFGLDLLGAARYPGVAINGLPTGWACGVFSSTFGDARPFIRKLLKTGKCPRVRIQLLWRDRHDFTEKDIQKAALEARKWAGLVQEFNWVEWYFSGACEHTKDAAWCKRMAEAVLAELPSVTYVNCPLTSGALIYGPQIINEVHPSEKVPFPKIPQGKFNFSFDGTACVDVDIEKYKATYNINRNETFFLWDARCNGKWESKNTTLRPNRIGWPDVKLIQSWVALIWPRGECSLPSKKWLLKSHAENHGPDRNGNPDLKGEKNCLICPIKTDKFEYRKNGKVVATLRYVGTYLGGGYRYYSQTMGYQISVDPVELWANGKKYGVVNPAFRFGYYR